MSGGGDWHESLFKPEKGDSLGDGSWGRESDEPDLAPVAWDKLPEAPKNKLRARLATPAPGSQKESGLLDIKALAPDLAKRMTAEDSAVRAGTGAAGGGARLATAAKGSTGSGLIDVQEIVRAQESAEGSAEPSLSGPSESSGAMIKESKLSSSLVDQVAIPMPRDDEDLDSSPVPIGGSRTPLMVMMGLLALAVAGLAFYVFTR
ncbi:MAG: hypothetical protein KDK70_18745 [Myxococcales bacterium]|nr:hypothetical protein [Myxococcales bacterium]